MNWGTAILGLLQVVPSALEAIGPLVARAKQVGEWTPEQDEEKRQIAEAFYAKHEHDAPPPRPTVRPTVPVMQP